MSPAGRETVVVELGSKKLLAAPALDGQSFAGRHIQLQYHAADLPVYAKWTTVFDGTVTGLTYDGVVRHPDKLEKVLGRPIYDNAPILHGASGTHGQYPDPHVLHAWRVVFLSQ